MKAHNIHPQQGLITPEQLPCNHRFKKETQWIFEGAAIKRLICVDCGFRFIYADPIAKETDYKWAQTGGKDETQKEQAA